ncbi:MAG: hypothetical protein IPK97_17470 [Ahniella sp.]|nr:hypothetical protein [Ahniella sp.]
MRDELKPAPNDFEQAVGEALRELPLQAPRRDLWAAIEADLPKPRTARRSWWPYVMATAAALVLAILVLPRERFEAGTRDTPNIATVDERAAWIAESQALESTLRSLERRPLDATSALAGAEIEDLISLTDLQLGVAAKPDDELALWQQRVALMNELAEVRRAGSTRITADYADMMPAAYRMN